MQQESQFSTIFLQTSTSPAYQELCISFSLPASHPVFSMAIQFIFITLHLYIWLHIITKEVIIHNAFYIISGAFLYLTKMCFVT